MRCRVNERWIGLDLDWIANARVVELRISGNLEDDEHAQVSFDDHGGG